MKFTKKSVDTVSNRIEGALRPLMEELGLTFKMGGGRYSAGNFTFKAQIIVDNEDGENWRNEKPALDWSRFCFKGRLSPSDLGRQYRTERGVMTIIGWKSHSRSYPVITMAENGDRYKSDAASVRHYLETSRVE